MYVGVPSQSQLSASARCPAGHAAACAPGTTASASAHATTKLQRQDIPRPPLRARTRAGTLLSSKVCVNVPPASAPARFRIAEESILDAAAAVFAAEGFDRATMDAI